MIRTTCHSAQTRAQLKSHCIGTQGKGITAIVIIDSRFWQNGSTGGTWTRKTDWTWNDGNEGGCRRWRFSCTLQSARLSKREGFTSFEDILSRNPSAAFSGLAGVAPRGTVQGGGPSALLLPFSTESGGSVDQQIGKLDILDTRACRSQTVRHFSLVICCRPRLFRVSSYTAPLQSTPPVFNSLRISGLDHCMGGSIGFNLRHTTSPETSHLAEPLGFRPFQKVESICSYYWL